MLGYLKTAVFLWQETSWAYGFYVQVVLLAPIALFIILIDSRLLAFTKEKQGESEDVEL